MQMGNSMGGYIAIRYAIEKGDSLELDGIVAIAPAIRNSFPISSVKYWVGRSASYVVPSMTVAIGLDSEHLSRKREVGYLYGKDPLVYDRISVQSGTDVTFHRKT
jgi:alpha-beta hydrolase superfamily lysophospholipase